MKRLAAAWDRAQLAVLRWALRLCDVVVLLPRPRLLWAYLELVWIELRHSPYRWPRSFESTLARTRADQNVRELVYGETPVITGIYLFWRAGVRRGAHVVDLGAGRGRALIAARWLGATTRGVELMAEHVRLVASPLAKVGIELSEGDGADVDLTGATHVYVTWTGYDEPTRQKFIQNACRQMNGARLIAVDAPAESAQLIERSRHDVISTWGSVPAWVYEVRTNDATPTATDG